MTNDKSREAFIEWFNEEFGESPDMSCDDTHWIHFGYQAAEQRIIEVLGSESFREFLQEKIKETACIGNYGNGEAWLDNPDEISAAAIDAIKQKVSGL